MHLTAFNARALTDVTAAVKNLEAQGAAELILDLRDNRGGLVQEGIEIAKLFLEGKFRVSPHFLCQAALQRHLSFVREFLRGICTKQRQCTFVSPCTHNPGFAS